MPLVGKILTVIFGLFTLAGLAASLALIPNFGLKAVFSAVVCAMIMVGYLFYAVPSSYGAVTFTVNGFSGGFNAAITISVTNANGVTQNYDLYESTNLLTGSVPVVVT